MHGQQNIKFDYIKSSLDRFYVMCGCLHFFDWWNSLCAAHLCSFVWNMHKHSMPSAEGGKPYMKSIFIYPSSW